MNRRTRVGRVRVSLPLTETIRYRGPDGQVVVERVRSALRLVVVHTRQPRRYAALLRARNTALAKYKRAVIERLMAEAVARKQATIAALLAH